MSDFARVTEILREVGMAPDFSGVPPHVLETARVRGQAVHKAIELLLGGQLEPSSVDESIWPRVAAFDRFLSEMEVKVLASERPVRSERLRYVGRLDLIVTFGADGASVVVDIKTGAVNKSAWLQMAGYACALREEGLQVDSVAVLELPASGDYRVRWPSEPLEELLDLWRNVVEIYHWKVKGKRNARKEA